MFATTDKAAVAPDPDVGLTVNHATLDVAVHADPPDTDTDVPTALAPGDHEDDDTPNAACVTDTFFDTPQLKNVTVPARAAMPVFAVTDKVTVADDADPDAAPTVNHEASDDAVQLAPEITDTDVLAGLAPGAHEDGDNKNAGCVTGTVFDTPALVNVTVPVRVEVPVFATTDNVTVADDDPDAAPTVNQEASDDAVQLALEVTDTDVLAAFAPGTHQDCDKTNAFCVTDTTLDTLPFVNVTVPERAEVPVFATTDNVAVADVDPDAGLTANHDALDDAAHADPPETDTDVLDASAPGNHDDDDTPNATCVTDTVFDTPTLVNVTVPVRAEAPVFAAADRLAVADVDPDVGLTVNQVALDDAVQLALEVTDTDVLDALALGDQAEDDNRNACCVTDTVFDTPTLVNVTVPVRAEAPVFAAADNVAADDVDPEAGLTVNQVALDDTVQLVLEVTDTDVLDALAPGDHVDDETPNACCATDTTLDTLPFVNVTVPERAEVPVFATTDNVAVADPDADVGLTLSHDALDEPVHAELPDTDTDVLDALAPGDHDDDDTPNAAWVTDTVFDTPTLVNVTVPERTVVPVFAATDRVAVADVDPDVGLTVNQAALDNAVQVALEFNDTDVLDALAPGDHEDSDKMNACCVTCIVLVTSGFPIVVANWML